MEKTTGWRDRGFEMLSQFSKSRPSPVNGWPDSMYKIHVEYMYRCMSCWIKPF